jgi:hypothetical protein
MKSNKSYVIQVNRNNLLTYLHYKVMKSKGFKMTFKDRYEKLKDNATTFNSYGKALAMLIDLDNSKDETDIKANETYDILEMGNN